MTAALEGGEWSAARPGRTLPSEDPVPILQEAGWATGPVWAGGISRPHRDSIPDCPARSKSLYRRSYRAHKSLIACKIKSRQMKQQYEYLVGFAAYSELFRNYKHIDRFC